MTLKCQGHCLGIGHFGTSILPLRKNLFAVVKIVLRCSVNLVHLLSKRCDEGITKHNTDHTCDCCFDTLCVS